MITLKTKKDLKILSRAGEINAFALKQIAKNVKIGVTTLELDHIAQRTIRARGGEPSFLGYRGYQFALCVSINTEVVHGIPSASRMIKSGDVVGLDLGIKYLNRYTDAALTIVVGKKTKEIEHLIAGTREALKGALAKVRPGVRVGEIEFETGRILAKYGLSPVLALCGHGVGYAVHEEPSIKSDGRKNSGPVLDEGMVLAIEPMATLGGGSVKTASDGWTVLTSDNSLAAHFEHTVVVTRSGARVLTGRI